uniref:Uncharacterized protein LOC111101946 isoform X2 n=1 Tax=Crassostrea virginica TaxID=6565 RepID=A0A8B8AG24_CRAVI|nr:uncharacterized protein LOC111101946 isoform X2 [Crassostrea virginica]XP_022290324.1 uncharacterized protein LOC111101946 isoform X2 [Crassostrea virginica]
MINMGRANGKEILRVFLTFVFLTSVINKVSAQFETTGIPTVTANATICPFILLTPSFLETDYGKRAIYTGFVEAKLEPGLKARWQFIRNEMEQDIDINTGKYNGSRLLPNLTLIINNAVFEDEGSYRLQVLIRDGWCSSTEVQLRKVRGILEYGEACNQTRECNERRNLFCSEPNKKCYCDSKNKNTYSYGKECFSQSNLRVVFNKTSSSITTSALEILWNDPSAHADIIKEYQLEISEFRGTFSVNESVGRANHHVSFGPFVPGHLFVVTITSVLHLNDIGEKAYIRSDHFNLVVEPFPPEGLDRSRCNFHPENIHLHWDLPLMNTSFDQFRVTISGNIQYAATNYIDWSHRLEPGNTYTVLIVTISWRSFDYEKHSTPHQEEITTIRTPKVTLPPDPFYPSFFVPYLSNMNVNASVQLRSEFPPILEVKWQKIRGSTAEDINTTSYSRYDGSTIDKKTPRLFIDQVNFDDDYRDGIAYRCLAKNSEGWGTSYNRSIWVIGSLKYDESCSETRECLWKSNMVCISGKCLCDSRHYQRDSRCYPRSNLEARTQTLESFACGNNAGFKLRWNPPTRDADLVKGYEVKWREQSISYDRRSGSEFVGLDTEFTTPCSLKLQPGRLYWTTIRTIVELRHPKDVIFVEETSKFIILDPIQPGQIIRSLSNFSADGMLLKWEKSSTSFVNRYKVTVGDVTRYTTGYLPEIMWNSLLMPLTVYKVSITAISYGYTTNYPTYGSKESQPFVNSIQTSDSKYSGKVYLPYGNDDYILSNEQKKNNNLKSPITVYVGDGSVEGFNLVYVGSNGILGLGEQFNSPNILEVNSVKLKDRRILCPFWTHLKSNKNFGTVYYNAYSRVPSADEKDIMFLELAEVIIKRRFKDFGDFKANWLVKVTWENMTLLGMEKERKVTFQTYLITDGENTFVVYNYVDVNLKGKKNKPISIGYRYKDIIERNSFSNQQNGFRMTVMPGNTGERGLWIYKMTEGVRAKKEENKCLFWFNYNQGLRIRQQLVANTIECPCDNRFLRFDPRFAISRFDRKNRILCYASVLVENNAECCFDMYADTEQLGPLQRSAPLAGTMLQYNPFLDQHEYTKNDFKPKGFCCRSNHCDLFYQVRPIPTCYRRSPFAPAGIFGDPHIRTLDGKLYTFNGYGEYTMIKINTSTIYFELQARTILATTQDGVTTNATVFSAFAAKDQTGSSVQIEMSQDKKSMTISANGKDLTRQFEDSNYTVLTSDISIRWDSGKISALFLKPLITVKVSLGNRLLVCETLVNKKFKGLASGLMGNFDDIDTNDFMLPNGTELDENSTRTEREIFHNFGQQWSVDEHSIFHYDKGMTFRDFWHPDFLPFFSDEVGEDRLNDAKANCGTNPSPSCVSDFLATGDIILASSSGKAEEASKMNVKFLENETPQISGNVTINAKINETVELQFNITDDGKSEPKYIILKRPTNFLFDNQTGIARWTPTNDTYAEISLLAEDDMGVQSPVFQVSINLCSGCNGHGSCDYNNVLSSEIAGFYKTVCECDAGYFGNDCENETDACQETPCSLNRTCIDLSPKEEILLGRGYNCSACPIGYDEIDSSCTDIDECESVELNDCNASTETCENIEGGFICNCLSGYKKVESHCIDIDECLAGTSECEQICHNSPGSFTCDCFMGFTLSADQHSCNKSDHDPCKDYEKNCEYTCSNVTGSVQCTCPMGYSLSVNGISCKDINECELPTTSCEHGCIKNKGSYNCTCRPGFFLNADKMSCTECEVPYYGQNCSKVCECGPGGNGCDAVHGCVCLSGWTGEKCDQDIDECSVNPYICGSHRICQNLEGTFSCTCGDGFLSVGDKCEDIDECSDLSLNDCPPSTSFCRNAYGNYSCECLAGFQMRNGACEDINECELSVHGCSHMCINTDGDYNCACYYGFTLGNNRKSCEKVDDIDTCSQFPGLECSYACRQQGHSSTSGICFCESGQKLDSDGKTCIDIDECSDGSPCAHNCTDTNSGFECDCAVGYKLQNDGVSCEECTGFFYGVDCETPCKCGRGAEACHHVTGCVCEKGWAGETCEIDVDECKSNPCIGDHETCLNTPGSYLCECTPGFNKSNAQCTDIDECKLLVSPVCQQKCLNTEGSYRCACNDGYKLENDKDCVDINECLDTNCHDCENLPGSFKCFCKEGFKVNSTTHMDCHNINECLDGTSSCAATAICTDTIGSYECRCPIGYKGDGHECTVCEDFTFGEQCSSPCTCDQQHTVHCNSVSGICSCKMGWEGIDCSKDVDECKEGSITCDTEIQTCVNTPGSAHCECRYGGVDLNRCITPKLSTEPNESETKVKLEVKFAANTSRQEFLTETENIMVEYENSLNAFYQRGNISGFSYVEVLSIRYGSLIIDYEIIGNTNDSNDFKLELAQCMSQLMSGGPNTTVLYQLPLVLSITIKDKNGNPQSYVSPSASPCSVMKSFGASCPSGEKCLDSAGRAVCTKDSDSDISTFLIIIGVTIPFSIIVIVVMTVWICHHKNANRVQEIDIKNDPFFMKMKEEKEYQGQVLIGNKKKNRSVLW